MNTIFASRRTTGGQYVLQRYFNIHLLNISGCNNGLCDWSYLKQKWLHLRLL